MSSFINPQFSSEHPGVNRVEAAFEGARELRARWTPTRGLVVLLLTAVLAAAVTVAYEVMDTAEEGHLLALWIALWVAVFAGLALFAWSRPASALKTSLNAWAHRQAMARADARLWRIASTDARVMADLQNAMSRVEVAMLTEPAAQSLARAEAASTSAAAELQSAKGRVEVAMLTESAVQSGMCAEIPSTLVSSGKRSYGFYI